MNNKHEKIVQAALIVVGLITYCVATYLIVQVVFALHALNTVPPQPKKLPEARALESGHDDFWRAAKISPNASCAVGPNRVMILVANLGWGVLHRGFGGAAAHPAPLQVASRAHAPRE
jgi:hypothetical protein